MKYPGTFPHKLIEYPLEPLKKEYKVRNARYVYDLPEDYQKHLEVMSLETDHKHRYFTIVSSYLKGRAQCGTWWHTDVTMTEREEKNEVNSIWVSSTPTEFLCKPFECEFERPTDIVVPEGLYKPIEPETIYLYDRYSLHRATVGFGWRTMVRVVHTDVRLG